MTTTSRLLDAPTDRVWAVLSDGWLYPSWVVGASRMRQVGGCPRERSRLHHSVGVWPLLIDDETVVLEQVPGTSMRLRARAWPGGEAEVTVTVEPQGDRCLVMMEEDAVRGPGVLVPRPLRSLLLTWRNVESLRRLAYLVEGRARG